MKLILIPLLCFVFAFKTSNVVAQEKGVALLIGNWDYNNNKRFDDNPLGDDLPDLSNPCRDIQLVKDSLKGTPFEGNNVTVECNKTAKEMAALLREFQEKLSDAGESAPGLLYLAGHGVEYGGTSYFFGVGARMDAAGVKRRGKISYNDAISVDEAIKAFGERPGGEAVIIFDICRDNPYLRRLRSIEPGNAKKESSNPNISYRTLSPTPGMLISFSTSPGRTADDGDREGNSPYAKALAKAIAVPNRSINDMFTEIRAEVLEKTEMYQMPSELSALTKRFCLGGCPSEIPSVSKETLPPAKQYYVSTSIQDKPKRSMRADVFWCARSKENQERATKIADKLTLLATKKDMEGGPLVSVRLRSLSEEANQNPGYHIKGNLIRFDRDSLDEIAWMNKIIKLSPEDNFQKSPVGSPTPGYISIFVCG